MGFAENRGDYYRARYKVAPGRYGTVKNEFGETVRYSKKRDAEKAANDAEADIRNGRVSVAERVGVLFGEYVDKWYAVQDLAASTMQNYRRHLEEHILPTFADKVIGEIRPLDVSEWEKSERAAGYAESSIKTWRGTLHLVFADAVDDPTIPIESNPAARRRGRGKRAGRSRKRGPEKAITTMLGMLLIAERAALLSGRDDEFAAIVTKGYSGIRWGELIGLEAQYVKEGGIRIEWQLYELDTGEFHRCPPKDDSYRTIDTPEWHSRLLADHLAKQNSGPCACHGLDYAFSGHRPSNTSARGTGAKLVDVARLAAVSVGTVSNVLNRPVTVPMKTRLAVENAISTLGYVRGGAPTQLAAHWRRNGFATWLFKPAATGWYPAKSPHAARPVPIIGEPWPGVPARGRNAATRADASWLPVAPGLTPHGLRHTHKTLLVELNVPKPLQDERMGHLDGSVQARYSHVTQTMRDQLMADLTDVWEQALELRRVMSPSSPVAVLNRLLRAS
ncbi:LacI family DNA-binding transcriptional regulator [Lentzea sp. NPDC003310]|uniref:LacI family DNA-binding transcriptional regulator n=1 Tax=Lentzea sp. NPDC003310 TaxID=3154447 RepID=UPI0033A85184